MTARGGYCSTSTTEPLPEGPLVGTWEGAGLQSSAFGRASQLGQTSLVLQDDSCWHVRLQLKAIWSGQCINVDIAYKLIKTEEVYCGGDCSPDDSGNEEKG